VDSAKHGAQPARASTRRRGSLEGELPAVYCFFGPRRKQKSGIPSLVLNLTSAALKGELGELG
jgi:hypothetical protein